MLVSVRHHDSPIPSGLSQQLDWDTCSGLFGQYRQVKNMALLPCSTCHRVPDLQGRLCWVQRLTTAGLGDDRVQPMLGTLSVPSR